MSIIIKSGLSTKELNVTSLSALTVNLPKVLDQAGFGNMVGEPDDGSITGSKLVRQLFVTQDYRLARNLETPLFNDTYAYNTMNNYKYRVVTSAQTITLSGGSMIFNSGDNISNGTSAIVQSFRTFPLYINTPLYVNIKAKFNNVLQNNSVTEFGLALTGGTKPSDGVFLIASAGTLNAVISYSGFEKTQVNVHIPEPNVLYDYLFAINDTQVEFWVDDVIVSVLEFSSATGSTVISNSLPLYIKNYNTGAVASPIQFQVNLVDVLFGDIKLNKPWMNTMVGMGGSSIAPPSGGAIISTANILNSLAPNVGILNNSVGGYVELGGQFAFDALNSSETDYILFGYLNPVATASIPGKTLVITSININTFTSGATTDSLTATTLQWSIGLGGTSLDLTTLDSVTAGTRAARRLGLGVQSIPITGATGTSAKPIYYDILKPLIVEAGTYCHIILKIPQGVATSLLVIRGLVNINGYFE